MNKIKVAGTPANVNSGQVQLSAAQAAARKHALKIVGKADKDGTAVYDVTGPIQFKVGETFGFSGEASKAGQLRDPVAEQLDRLAAEEKAVAVAVAAVRAEYEAKIATLRETVRAEIEAELKAA